MGTTQMGKSPAMPPPIWKKPMPSVPAFSVYQSARNIMYSMPLFIMPGLQSPLKQWPAKMLPKVLSSQPGQMMGRLRSAAATIQLSFGSI